MNDEARHLKGPRVDRRRFISEAAVLAAAALLNRHGAASAAEPPPETTRLRIFEGPVSCIAPMLVTQQLLHAEGFTDIHYVKYGTDTNKFPPDDLIAGDTDINVTFIATDILHVDAADPVVILGGSHVGCVDVVAAERVKSTRELRGKTVAVDTDTKVFVSLFAAYVGLDPERDINWSVQAWEDWPRLLQEGKVDAFMTGPPLSVELR